MNVPKVFYYNPTCEIAISNGTVSYTPNKNLTKFEKDLDILPMYFANENDIVLVQEIPDQRFLEIIKNVGYTIPRFQQFGEFMNSHNDLLTDTISLHPWGWSPRIHHIFKPLKEKCCKEFLDQPNAYWKSEHKDLYSRRKALTVLNTFLKEHPKGYISDELKARICTSVKEVEQLIEQWKQIVIKAPWSSSGRGLQVLRQPYLNKSIIQWINGTLETQGYVMIEALLNKEHDFSLQYYCDGHGNLQFIGPGFFETNSNGQYVGNLLGEMPNKLKECLNNDKMQELTEGVTKAILSSDLAQNYCGFLGVDCMIFKNQQGETCIHPCVEINLRYNMGTLAIFLNKYLAPGTNGYFKVHFQPKSTFDDFHQNMISEHPFIMKDGKWLSGYLPLVSPFQGKSFGMYLVLENNEGV